MVGFCGTSLYHFAEVLKGEIIFFQNDFQMKKKPTNRNHFASSNEKAKSRIITQMVHLARKERLDYADFIYVCQQAHKKLGLRRPKKERKLPQLLPEADFKKFFRVIQQCGDLVSLR